MTDQPLDVTMMGSTLPQSSNDDTDERGDYFTRSFMFFEATLTNYNWTISSLSLVIEILQFFAFALNPHLPGNFVAWSVVFFSHLPMWDGTYCVGMSYKQFLGFYWAFTALPWLSLAIFVFSMTKGSSMPRLLIKTFWKHIYSAFSTTLLVPLVHFLLSAMVCKYPISDSSASWQMPTTEKVGSVAFLFPMQECGAVIHRIHESFSIALLILWPVMTLFLLSCNVPFDIASASIRRRQESILDLVLLIYKIGLCISFHFLLSRGMESYYTFIVAAMSYIMAVLYGFFLPYYSKNVNRILVVSMTLVGWCATTQYITFFQGSTLFVESGDYYAVLCVPGAILGIAAYLMSQIRYDRHTMYLQRRCRYRGFVPLTENPFAVAALQGDSELLPFPRRLPRTDLAFSEFRAMEAILIEEGLIDELRAASLDMRSAVDNRSTTKNHTPRAERLAGASRANIAHGSRDDGSWSSPTTSRARGALQGKVDYFGSVSLESLGRVQVVSPTLSTVWVPTDAEACCRFLNEWQVSTSTSPTPYMIGFACRILTRCMLMFPDSPKPAIAFSLFLCDFAPSIERMNVVLDLLRQIRSTMHDTVTGRFLCYHLVSTIQETLGHRNWTHEHGYRHVRLAHRRAILSASSMWRGIQDDESNSVPYSVRLYFYASCFASAVATSIELYKQFILEVFEDELAFRSFSTFCETMLRNADGATLCTLTADTIAKQREMRLSLNLKKDAADGFFDGSDHLRDQESTGASMSLTEYGPEESLDLVSWGVFHVEDGASTVSHGSTALGSMYYSSLSKLRYSRRVALKSSRLVIRTIGAQLKALGEHLPIGVLQMSMVIGVGGFVLVLAANLAAIVVILSKWQGTTVRSTAFISEQATLAEIGAATLFLATIIPSDTATQEAKINYENFMANITYLTTLINEAEAFHNYLTVGKGSLDNRNRATGFSSTLKTFFAAYISPEAFQNIPASFATGVPLILASARRLVTYLETVPPHEKVILNDDFLSVTQNTKMYLPMIVFSVNRELDSTLRQTYEGQVLTFGLLLLLCGVVAGSIMYIIEWNYRRMSTIVQAELHLFKYLPRDAVTWLVQDATNHLQRFLVWELRSQKEKTGATSAKADGKSTHPPKLFDSGVDDQVLYASKRMLSRILTHGTGVEVSVRGEPTYSVPTAGAAAGITVNGHVVDEASVGSPIGDSRDSFESHSAASIHDSGIVSATMGSRSRRSQVSLKVDTDKGDDALVCTGSQQGVDQIAPVAHGSTVTAEFEQIPLRQQPDDGQGAERQPKPPLDMAQTPKNQTLPLVQASSSGAPRGGLHVGIRKMLGEAQRYSVLNLIGDEDSQEGNQRRRRKKNRPGSGGVRDDFSDGSLRSSDDSRSDSSSLSSGLDDEDDFMDPDGHPGRGKRGKGQKGAEKRKYDGDDLGFQTPLKRNKRVGINGFTIVLFVATFAFVVVGFIFSVLAYNGRLNFNDAVQAKLVTLDCASALNRDILLLLADTAHFTKSQSFSDFSRISQRYLAADQSMFQCRTAVSDEGYLIATNQLLQSVRVSAALTTKNIISASPNTDEAAAIFQRFVSESWESPALRTSALELYYPYMPSGSKSVTIPYHNSTYDFALPPEERAAIACETVYGAFARATLALYIDRFLLMVGSESNLFIREVKFNSDELTLAAGIAVATFGSAAIVSLLLGFVWKGTRVATGIAVLTGLVSIGCAVAGAVLIMELRYFIADITTATELVEIEALSFVELLRMTIDAFSYVFLGNEPALHSFLQETTPESLIQLQDPLSLSRLTNVHTKIDFRSIGNYFAARGEYVRFLMVCITLAVSGFGTTMFASDPRLSNVEWNVVLEDSYALYSFLYPDDVIYTNSTHDLSLPAVDRIKLAGSSIASLRSTSKLDNLMGAIAIVTVQNRMMVNDQFGMRTQSVDRVGTALLVVASVAVGCILLLLLSLAILSIMSFCETQEEEMLYKIVFAKRSMVTIIALLAITIIACVANGIGIFYVGEARDNALAAAKLSELREFTSQGYLLAEAMTATRSLAEYDVLSAQLGYILSHSDTIMSEAFLTSTSVDSQTKQREMLFGTPMDLTREEGQIQMMIQSVTCVDPTNNQTGNQRSLLVQVQDFFSVLQALYSSEQNTANLINGGGSIISDTFLMQLRSRRGSLLASFISVSHQTLKETLHFITTGLIVTTTLMGVALIGSLLLLFAYVFPSLNAIRTYQRGLKLALTSLPEEMLNTAPEIREYFDPETGTKNDQVKKKMQQSEKLLQNILPPNISRRLKNGERVIADTHPNVTAMFAALVGFDEYSQHMEARQIVHFLNSLIVAFDHIVDLLDLEKVKTIGDIYFLCGGLTKKTARDHPVRCVECAHFFLEALEDHNVRYNTPNIRLRVGINTGPAVAGVIGNKKVAYDIWGDSVNTASRMMSTGLPGCVQISESTHQLVSSYYQFTPRQVQAKGKGKLTAYIYEGRLKPTPYTDLNWRLAE